MGGAGRTVECDETLIGVKESVKKPKGAGGGHHKNLVLTLIERRTRQPRRAQIEGKRLTYRRIGRPRSETAGETPPPF